MDADTFVIIVLILEFLGLVAGVWATFISPDLSDDLWWL